MGTRRKADDLGDTEEDDDGTEELESEEAEGDQLPTGRKRRKGAGGATGEDDAADEDAADSDDEEEEVDDPIARAVARAEARIRHKYLKPLRAEVERLKRDAGNAGAAVETVRSLQLENHFLRLAGATFHDSAAAFKLADTSQVQITDTGKVTGMDAVIDQLMETHPYLVRDADDDEGEDFTSPDLPSGRPMNKQRKPANANANDAALYKRYPALQRRRGW